MLLKPAASEDLPYFGKRLQISRQQQLFKKLEPDSIGISINKQFLMELLKSISGVLIAGKQEIHSFENDF